MTNTDNRIAELEARVETVEANLRKMADTLKTAIDKLREYQIADEVELRRLYDDLRKLKQQ